MTWDNFFVGGNALTVEACRAWLEAGADRLFLYGASGAGKTHLLRAVSHDAASERGDSCYLDLSVVSVLQLNAAVHCHFVLLDNIDAVIGQAVWENSLFQLFNALHCQGGRVMFSASLPPQGLDVKLQDLYSRLCSCLVCALQPVTESAIQPVAMEYARALGLVVPEAVWQYMSLHCQRDIQSWLSILDALSEATLCFARPVTVPLLRQLLSA